MVKIAFLFPGQGSQSIGMGKTAAETSLRARTLLDEADTILGFSISKIMFEGPEEKLKETVITQPALFLASAAGLELLKERGIQASWVAGHSLGEYSALYAAGAIGFKEALLLVQERGKSMQQAAERNPGSMAAIIGLDFEKLSDICRTVAMETNAACAPANFNSESQIVISGDTGAIQKTMQKATEAGAAKVIQLNVSGAFHSSLMSEAVQRMRPVIEGTQFSASKIPVITNVDAQPTTDPKDFQQKLIKQIDNTVRWHESLKKLIDLGTETFIEVGSGRVLSTMAKKLDRKKNALSTEDMESIDKTLSTQISHP